MNNQGQAVNEPAVRGSWTVCILEPCCPRTEPWYQGRERCCHMMRRRPVVSVYSTEAEAQEEFKRTQGWGSVGGWMVEGLHPVPGFRVQPVRGDSVNGHWYAAPWELPFPTVKAAETYAEAWNEWPDGSRRRHILYNVVDPDGITVWSSFGTRLGSKRDVGDPA